MRNSTSGTTQDASGNADDGISNIIRLFNNGNSIKKIAIKTGLSITTVEQVIKRRQKSVLRKRG